MTIVRIMTRWEYLVRNVSRDMSGDVNAKMNELGLQGWELVSISVINSVEHFFFKRAIQLDPKDAT